MQSLWAEQVEWDEEPPSPILQQWTKYREALQELKSIRIPRWVLPSAESKFTLHGFSDASEKAYGAAVYVVADHSTPHLLILKTKVAPVKRTTLPRLALCGAVLLAKLISRVSKALTQLNSGNPEAYAWTDSTIVLAWISSNANRWSTFVGNRVAQIQEHLPPSKWNHVRSEDNPADAASRGITPRALKNNNLWWHGPSWLSSVKMSQCSKPPTQTTEEERKMTHHNAAIPMCPTTKLLESFSLLSKLVRVTANLRRGLSKSKVTTIPTVQELRGALLVWIKQAQSVAFSFDMAQLKKTGNVSSTSKLACLHPFLDEDGFLRVNGRIQRSSAPLDQRQPLLLPKDSHLTKLIIQQEHHRLLHAGPQPVRASLQQNYWIPAGQGAVRKVTRRCIVCAKAKAITQQQLMGELPPQRVTASPPFTVTGVDYAGPFELRVQKLRGQARYKAYACIFVCLSTKAVHLELVSDLTTEGFIGALFRFTSQRGKPTQMHSDNGTNFQGAANTLKEWYQWLQEPRTSTEISRQLARDGIEWKFIPPSAPHMGGLWEAAVKKMKYHLNRIMKDAGLTYEQFYTVLKRVEAILNSRPLLPASTDPRDPEPLTPAHFLIGRPLTAWPEVDLSKLNPSRLNRWQRVQQLSQHLWNRWSKEYLSSLQARPKGWTQQKNNLLEGDLVIIKQENLPPLRWEMARVTQVHKGEDGLVQVVTVKTANGKLFQRPIVKLCRLPVDTQP